MTENEETTVSDFGDEPLHETEPEDDVVATDDEYIDFPGDLPGDQAGGDPDTADAVLDDEGEVAERAETPEPGEVEESLPEREEILDAKAEAEEAGLDAVEHGAPEGYEYDVSGALVPLGGHRDAVPAAAQERPAFDEHYGDPDFQTADLLDADQRPTHDLDEAENDDLE